jgi:hypothetical protein
LIVIRVKIKNAYLMRAHEILRLFTRRFMRLSYRYGMESYRRAGWRFGRAGCAFCGRFAERIAQRIVRCALEGKR